MNELFTKRGGQHVQTYSSADRRLQVIGRRDPHGLQLAKTVNAKVTGFYVMPEFHVFTYKTEMLEDTKREFAEDSKAHAAQYLSVIETAAKTAGVTCEIISANHDHPTFTGRS